MKTSFTLVTLFLTLSALAQTEVREGPHAFADGVYPSYSVVFAGTDDGYVEKFMRDRLKPVSTDMGGKKEVMSSGTRLPEVSNGMMRVFVKAEQAGKGGDVTAHVAFMVNNVFVGPESEEAVRKGCHDWVYQQAVMLKRSIVQDEVESSQKTLDRLHEDLAGLVKDKARLENNLEKNDRKVDDDQREREQVDGESKLMGERVAAKRQQMAAAPSEALTKEFDDLEKEQEKLTHKVAKLTEDIADGRKKSEELQYQIKLNLLEQDLKTKEITAQGKVVKDLVIKQAAMD